MALSLMLNPEDFRNWMRHIRDHPVQTNRPELVTHWWMRSKAVKAIEKIP